MVHKFHLPQLKYNQIFEFLLNLQFVDNIRRPDRDNTIDVYIVEGNPVLWYNVDEVVYEPVISEAYFAEDSSKKIYMTLSRMPGKVEDIAKLAEVTDEDGTQYAVTSAESEVQAETEEDDTSVPEDPVKFDSLSLTLRQKDAQSGEMLLAYSSPIRPIRTRVSSIPTSTSRFSVGCSACAPSVTTCLRR